MHRNERQSFRDLFDSFHVGVQYALAVGAASAAVGIVVGVINTTGVGFRLGFMVTGGAADMATTIAPFFDWSGISAFSQSSIQQFLSLVLIAMACILMGAGLPTTALYIMLVAVAQPALAQLGVPALATHMFVLYYGVISEITPPVCASAYAAAGIAGSNPFRTGISAFTLGIGKLMVPMVFVYAPTMLIVLPEYFTWASFIQVTVRMPFLSNIFRKALIRPSGLSPLMIIVLYFPTGLSVAWVKLWLEMLNQPGGIFCGHFYGRQSSSRMVLYAVEQS